ARAGVTEPAPPLNLPAGASRTRRWRGSDSVSLDPAVRFNRGDGSATPALAARGSVCLVLHDRGRHRLTGVPGCGCRTVDHMDCIALHEVRGIGQYLRQKKSFLAQIVAMPSISGAQPAVPVTVR